MAYYLMNPRRQLRSEGKLLDSITMRSHEHYITDRMIESCSFAFHTKRRRGTQGSSRRYMLTSPSSLGTDFEDLDTIGRRWYLILSPMPIGVTLVRSMVTSCTKHRDIFIQYLLHGHSRCGKWMSLDPLDSNIQGTLVHLGYNCLLL